MKSYPRHLVWLAAVVLAAASCGGGGGSSTTPTSPSSSTPSTPSTPSSPGTPVTSACAAIVGFLGSPQGIVNGSPCSLETTAVVRLNMKDAYGESLGFCSGTIIAARAVLTAAHCVDGEVRTVLVYQGVGGGQVSSTSFTAHPSYHKTSNGSSGLDIGVVIMESDLARTPLPLLFSREARVGEQAIVAGWGQDETGSVNDKLQAGTTAVSAVTSTWLEAANSSTSGNVCAGDSGGPMLLSEAGAWVVGGVTSATSGGAYCTSGSSYFANLRNGEAQSFILGLVPGLTPK